MSIDIFISYAREDLRQHSQIQHAENALTEAGYAVWRDNKLPAGEAYPYDLARTIEAARLVIVFWGAASVRSQWVYEEAERGKREGKLLPVMLANVTIPMGFGLLQAIDLGNWTGESNAPEFRSLRQAIADRIGPPSTDGSQLLSDVQEYMMYDRGWDFSSAASLNMDSAIGELLEAEDVDMDDPENEGFSRDQVALLYLIEGISGRAHFESPGSELPHVEVLGDLLRFLLPYSTRPRRSSSESISFADLEALLRRRNKTNE